jgi:hypothetical protein
MRRTHAGSLHGVSRGGTAVRLVGRLPCMRESIAMLLLCALAVPAFAERGSTERMANPSGDAAASAARPKLNGFEIEPKNPNWEHIRGGGPARDAIRSVDAPEFSPASQASWAPPPVAAIGLEIDGDARAYPVHLMECHQIVFGTVGGVPVAVTFDPLTAIPLVWERKVDGRVLEFGVSGLLYLEQFLLFDRETESLWAQYDGVAVAGPLAGTKLRRVPSRQEPVGAWMNRHHSSTVLARPERKKIDYRHSPYEAYWASESVPVPVRAEDRRYHPKEVVLGVEVDGKYRAYLGSILSGERGRIVDTFRGQKIRILYDSNVGLFMYEASDAVVVTDAYWFAWKSLHPETEIWHDQGSEH